MNRRDALTGAAAAGLASSLSAANAAESKAELALHPQVIGPRMNFAQADKVMTELGIDALVMGNGTNFQYATGNRPVITRMGRPPSTFAIVTRRENERLAVVTALFSYYYTLSDMMQHSEIPAYLFDQSYGDLHENPTERVPLALFRDRGEVPTDNIENERVAASNKALAEQGRHGTLEKALAAALKDLGLTKARIATDHVFVDRLVQAAAPKATTVDADDALRRIRPVKSGNEIQLMRQSASGNVAAALEALKTVRAGGSYRDLRAEFYAAAARRGHRGVFMVIDRTSDELYDNTFRDGQSILIDCVSEYEGYHGDYGRTVFIGEPMKQVKNATDAMANGWDAVREQLRPGITFSEIQAMGQKALRKANKSYKIPFSPHSVGLYHSDHVGQTGLPPREDIVLVPGMILSIDCPLIETGVGGSAHLEDLMLITADGAEPINDTAHQTITV